MPRPAVIAGSLGLVVFAVLGFRIRKLEGRIERLALQVDDSQGVAQQDAATTPDKPSVSGLNHHERLLALERQLRALRMGVFRIRLSMQPSSGPPDPQSVDSIRSVVDAETRRRRNVQLEWERPRWLGARKAQLVSFAHDHKLSTQQVSELEKGLEGEVNSMLEVLGRPDLYDDPERTARDWEQLLAQTDGIAERVLSAQQLAVWKQVRGFERKVLWPWLPDER